MSCADPVQLFSWAFCVWGHQPREPLDACRERTHLSLRGASKVRKRDIRPGIKMPSERIKRRVSAGLKKRVAYRQHYVCKGCNKLLPPTYEVDHIVPLFKGGSNHEVNLQVSKSNAFFTLHFCPE